MISQEYRRQLEQSKPQPDQFESEEEFQEAYGYWMSHQGRILALNRHSPEATPEQEAFQEKFTEFARTLGT